ncbi:MAG: mechanosensitive ion channel [Deltaproteobacteria bacterium]|nr:mechanosensitive ion channel [Deltaproteobacteria bacterium]
MTITYDDLRHFADEHLFPLALRVLVALLVFGVGRSVIRLIGRVIDRAMERSSVEPSLRKFLGDIMYAVMFVAITIVALDMVGVETTAVVAVLGAAGLAIGLALQGSLSNFAAGVMLIVLRPYKVTDLVMIGKYLGRVDAIRVFHTILTTADHRQVTIPNSLVISQPIENLTVLGHRRVELVVTIGQDAKIADVKRLLESAVLADERVQRAPAPSIDLAEVSDGSLKLFLRPWTTCDQYAEVAASTMERLKDTMTGAGLKFTIAIQP